MNDIQVYLLAGLGFDERIFSKLELANCKVNYLHWLEPELNESFENYVFRIRDQIKVSEKPVILIGHSFGGIVVSEISKSIPVQKVIIISSIKSSKELPLKLKFLKYFPLYKFLNKQLILKSFPIWANRFGYKSEKGRKLFIDMISKCSTNYCRWSLEKIVCWQGNDNISNLVHIHGSNDKTFPISRVKNAITIKEGTHFMVYYKASEVSRVLNELV